MLPYLLQVIYLEVKNESVSGCNIPVFHGRMLMLTPFMQAYQHLSGFGFPDGKFVTAVGSAASEYSNIPFSAGIHIFYRDYRINFSHLRSFPRSEERVVGKECVCTCRSRCSRYH